ncbi:protease HtpX [Geomicrobium sp. JSM 1781026]|uniref:protease HtpX n=1 Tax=Geomicrobium sp. JSM 1781026 TaxID=3344580 RepID=UPI0035C268CD
MGKRVFLFILTNILVMTTIFIVWSIISRVFDIHLYSSDGMLQLLPLAIFSLMFGFGGAFISLAMSRWIAKKMMKVRVLDPNGNLNQYERSVVEKVHRMSRAAGLAHMPEVGIYHSKEVNAFATGPSKKRSLVAVSTGLLESMDDDAVEGVIAHEVAHVSNGDMVTMTLLQGIVNAIVIFAARVVAFVAAQFVRQELQWIVNFVMILVLQILFSILGSLVVNAFSRYREYHADNGGADLAGKDKMIHALQSLQRYAERATVQDHRDDSAVQTMKINGNGGMMRLFSTHPALSDRIARLEQK